MLDDPSPDSVPVPNVPPPTIPTPAGAKPAGQTKPSRRTGNAKSEDRHAVEHGVTIYRVPSKSPVWYVQYSNHGRQIRRSLGTASKKRAVELAQAQSRDRHQGLLGPSDGKTLLMETVIQEYLSAVRSKGRVAATVDGYCSKLAVFKAFCLEQGVRHLGRIDAGLMTRFQKRLEEKGYVPPDKRTAPCGRGRHKRTGQKPRTVRDKLKCVRQLCLFAVRRGHLQRDPTAAFDIPGPPADRAYCWPPEEVARVLAQIPAQVLDVFRFYALTGLRAQELCWLTKADLSADGSSIQIRAKTCPLTSTPWQPKRRHERVVPLAQEAIAIAQRAATASKSCWIFEAPGTANGDGRWRRSRLWNTLKQAMAAAGVTRGTLHTFRHFSCTQLGEAGVPPISIMQILGHNDLKMVQHYSHPTASHLSAAVANLTLAPTQPATIKEEAK